MVDSVTSPLGADAFSGPMYGARAFFDALNAAGGIGGRHVTVVTCDDAGNGAGNQQCVHRLIDSDHVFAFAGNSVYDYAGAAYVSARDVPDIGGEPISTAYDQYPHLYSIYGSDEPRQGTIGWGGQLAGGTEVYRWVKTHLGVHVAGVVSYNQASSQSYASLVARGLRAEGFTVVSEQVDFALPDFGAAVLDMKAHGVQAVFDAIDTGGNAQLCQAMDQNGLAIKAKVTTVQSWDATVPTQYANSPTCRGVLYATSSDRNYQDTRYPAVAAFRAAMARYFPNQPLSEWELEGWASAQWLTDAVRSCGSDVTHACVERYMNQPTPYDAHGLIIPTSFAVSRPGTTMRDCLDVARWVEGRGWVTQVPDMDTTCYTVPVIWYSP
jgi:branched-chain amino acid transport system substrate-binding protein